MIILMYFCLTGAFGLPQKEIGKYIKWKCVLKK